MKVPMKRIKYDDRLNEKRLSQLWVRGLNMVAIVISLLCRVGTLILKCIRKYREFKTAKEII